MSGKFKTLIRYIKKLSKRGKHHERTFTSIAHGRIKLQCILIHPLIFLGIDTPIFGK